MAKATRPHAPGCIFHITARTQGPRALFTEHLRQEVVSEIKSAARSSGMFLHALAIMPNHFHIILRQGNCPLAYMMHRVMHRTALLLKRQHQLRGHIFESRYWSGLLPTPQYVREAIVYTHLNPWRAGLCEDPADSEWTTHSLYLLCGAGAPHGDDGVDAAGALRLFRRSEEEDDALKQYLDHIRFRMAVVRFLRGELESCRIVAPSECIAGDACWLQEFAPCVDQRVNSKTKRPIYDVAKQLLARIDPECPLDAVRNNSRYPRVVYIRRNLVIALIAQDFRRVDIARFMGLTPSAVSLIGAVLRR